MLARGCSPLLDLVAPLQRPLGDFLAPADVSLVRPATGAATPSTAQAGAEEFAFGDDDGVAAGDAAMGAAGGAGGDTPQRELPRPSALADLCEGCPIFRVPDGLLRNAAAWEGKGEGTGKREEEDKVWV